MVILIYVYYRRVQHGKDDNSSHTQNLESHDFLQKSKKTVRRIRAIHKTELLELKKTEEYVFLFMCFSRVGGRWRTNLF